MGLTGVASAQSPGATIFDDDAFVFNPVFGYSYDIVTTDGAPTAILAVGVAGGLFPVVVEFLPAIDGAAIINPGVAADIIAERAG